MPSAHKYAYILALLPPLLWSTNLVLAKAAVELYPPVQLSFLRWALAFVLLLPFGWRQLSSDVNTARAEIGTLLFLSLFGVTAFNSLVYTAFLSTSAINAGVLNTGMPLVTFVLAAIFLSQKITWKRLVGLAFAATGAVTVILRGLPPFNSGIELTGGDLLVVAGLTCWAIYTVFLRKRPTRLKPLAFLTLIFGLGAALHLPFVAYEWLSVGPVQFSWNLLLLSLYLAIGPSIVAYIVWNFAIQTLGPGRTSSYMYTMPLFSAALAVLFLGETLYLYHVLGLALIMIGLWLISK